MTNLLDLVPAFQRQLGRYAAASETESQLAAYIADATQALMMRWDRDYEVTFTEPLTFTVDPDIAQKDIRPIILMASIIYKSASASGLAAYTDGDFSYVPLKGAANPIELDRTELLTYLGKAPRLAPAVSAPLRGFAFAFNKEAYTLFLSGGWITDGFI